MRDLEQSLAFYGPVCGLTEVFREPGIKAIFLSNGSSHHDFAIMGIDDKPRIGRDGHVQIPTGRGTRPSLNHLGWEMENEKLLVEAYRRAVTAGVDINRTTDHGMSHSVYLFDPEGIFLEFYADATDNWKAFYAASQNQLISGNWDPLARGALDRTALQRRFRALICARGTGPSAADRPRDPDRAGFYLPIRPRSWSAADGRRARDLYLI